MSRSQILPLLMLLSLTGATGLGAQGLELELETVATELTLPLLVTHAGDGSGRLFIVQQTGEIRILKNGLLLNQPFLDISSLISCCNERGLLGLTFDPEYSDNGLFYVSYTSTSDGNSVLARYSVSAADPDLADPQSAEILLEVEQPYPNHNGGHLAFGPDGYLYLGLGDGGSAGDPGNNAQDEGNLLGSILRIDPEGNAPAEPNDLCGLNPDYGIPPDNPFIGGAGDCDEIWAYGLRNPWRFSFDRQTGDLWIGDVGQNCREEIDFEPFETDGGLNYGWRLMEGDACFDVDNPLNCDDPPTDCNDGSLTLPVLGYPHGSGFCNSVTGGYRYRGGFEPQLEGVYLYGEYCEGWISGTVPRCDEVWESQVVLETGFAISSFGEDEAGEMYVVEYSGGNGKVHRLKVAPGSGGPLLAATPAPVDFGVVETGATASRELLLTNTNAGREAALVAEMALSDELRFALDVDGGANPCGTETPCLPPGESCTVEVTFSPAEEALVSESLSIEGNFSPTVIGLVAKSCAELSVELENLPPITGSEQYEACDWLAAGPGVEVTAGGSLTLTAGSRVILRDGFSVAAGGSLVAAVDPSAGLP